MPIWPPEFVVQDGEAAFGRWLEEDVERVAKYRSFQAFLRERGADDIVPTWQLMRVDAFYAAKCELSPFAIPPENLWPNVVPALKIVRDQIIPETGPVTVLSSYRTQQVNVCARGASRSKHLSFSALDLATRDRQRGEALYRRLCAIHTQAGPASRMGLGAYFDPDQPGYAGGRFHIDAEGYRSWGRGYTAASSPCKSFN